MNNLIRQKIEKGIIRPKAGVDLSSNTWSVSHRALITSLTILGDDPPGAIRPS